MRERSLADVAAAVRGSLVPPEAGRALARGVATDSRGVRPGDLFFALPGDHADGLDYVGESLARGAAAAVVPQREVERSVPGHGDGHRPAYGPLVEVEDPGRALLDLAREERRSSTAIVVGVTGSSGKTCTKDFTAAVLAGSFRAAASEASFNNEVGLPLTVLRAPADAEVLVCEMGSRGPGHIRLLCEVARPQIGVVTNIGLAHMELFGSPRALREAKGELPASLPAGGTAILNADDDAVRSLSGRTRARSVLFGAHPEAEVRAEAVEVGPGTGLPGFRLVTPGGSAPVTLPVPGEHMVWNALAAAAVGWTLGVPVQEVALRLQRAVLTPGRMQAFEGPGGIRVLDDAYNANPASMSAALRSARWMAGSGRCVAVLGHMAELGPIADREHERVGELCARLGIEELIVVGPEAVRIAAGAEREGVEPDRIVRCHDIDGAWKALGARLRPGDLVLVKASRVVGLERLARALREGVPGGGAA